MSYIVIEKHGGSEYAFILTDLDGNNMVYDDKEDAEEEADNCQDGFVVEIE